MINEVKYVLFLLYLELNYRKWKIIRLEKKLMLIKLMLFLCYFSK